MSDDKDDLNASEWLSNQFNPTEQVPQQPTGEAPQPAEPPATQPPAVQSPFGQPSAPTPAVAPPDDASAFDWLLGQGSAPSAPSVLSTPSAPLVPEQQAPPPLVQPPSPTATTPTVASPAVPSYGAPTEPYTPVGEPTRPLSWDEFAATQQAPAAPQPAPGLTQPTFTDEPTQAFTVPPWEPTAPARAFTTAATAPFDGEQQHDPTSAIDSLFGDHQFQAYEEVGVLQTVQAVPGRAETETRPPRAPLSRTQKTLMGVAGGLIGVLVLIAMFFLGQHLGAAQAAAPTSAPTGASTKAPTSAGTGGPASPGAQPWSALQGGECITGFTSAWSATFTVVNCTSDHTAEMVFKGNLPDAAGSAYPTTTALQTELTGLCSAPTAINYSTAKLVTDLQVSFSYPPTSAKWAANDRTYYCFVDRQSGGDLTGDLSVQKTGN